MPDPNPETETLRQQYDRLRGGTMADQLRADALIARRPRAFLESRTDTSPEDVDAAAHPHLARLEELVAKGPSGELQAAAFTRRYAREIAKEHEARRLAATTPDTPTDDPPPDAA